MSLAAASFRNFCLTLFCIRCCSASVYWEGLRLLCLSWPRIPFGPATTLESYLNQTGWSLDVDGTLDGPDYLQCNLLSGSCKYISKTVRLMWNHYILTLLDRKGVGDFLPDVHLFHAVFPSWLKVNKIFLDWMWQAHSRHRAKNRNGIQIALNPVNFGDGTDTREHRLLERPQLKMIRTQQKDACDVLTYLRQEWFYLPIPRTFDRIVFLHAFLRTIKMPEVSALENTTAGFLIYFTDDAQWLVLQLGLLWKTFLHRVISKKKSWILFLFRSQNFRCSVYLKLESYLVNRRLLVQNFLPWSSLLWKPIYLIRFHTLKLSLMLHMCARLSGLLNWAWSCLSFISWQTVNSFPGWLHYGTKTSSKLSRSRAVGILNLLSRMMTFGRLQVNIVLTWLQKQQVLWYEGKYGCWWMNLLSMLKMKRCLCGVIVVTLWISMWRDVSWSMHLKTNQCPRWSSPGKRRREISNFLIHMPWDEALDDMLKFHPPDWISRPGVECEDEVFHMWLQGANIAKAF